MLKKKIDSLGEVLKKCEFYKSRLEAIFPKKHIPKKQSHITHTHVHKSQTSHSHHTKHPKHVHTSHTHHAFIYGKVYACTYYGRKGHLVKFCYDRLNASHHNVWVRNTNFQGPKKIWVPKSMNLLNDVCTFQGSTT